MPIIIKYIFFIMTLVCVFLLARSLFTLLFAMDNYNIHKKRLKQLQFNNKKAISEEEQTKEFINKVTNPVIRYVLPKLKLRDTEELKKDLELSKWNKYFSPIQFRAMQITLTCAGIGFCIIFYLLTGSRIFGLIWLLALAGLFPFLFTNSVKERKSKLLSEFPDFIRITQGYLTANVPFSKAVEKSIQYIGEEWKPLLQNFVVTCDVKSVEDAIDELKEKVDIFEVKELLALIKLNLDQGIDVRDSFDRQAEKVREMQLEIMSAKIAKRQMMCIALQAPLLLTLLGSFGLPTFSSMTNFSSM